MKAEFVDHGVLFFGKGEGGLEFYAAGIGGLLGFGEGIILRK